MSRFPLACALFGLILLAACSPDSQHATASPLPTACGEHTALTTYPGQPTGRGALAGPLLFEANALGDRAAVDFMPGYPTKVVIQRVKSVQAPITLEGWDCGTGQRLHFWYRKDCCPFPLRTLPVSDEQLAEGGDSTAILPPAEGSTAERGYAYGGYMLFTRPGKWNISVSQEGHRIGNIILLVRPRTT